jgi:hypothetical protein
MPSFTDVISLTSPGVAALATDAGHVEMRLDWRMVVVSRSTTEGERLYFWTDGYSETLRFDLLSWRWLKRERMPYVAATLSRPGKSRLVYLHRFAMSAPPQLVVDHINHDPADCRLENLRLATRSQNQANQRSRRHRASRFIGVTRTHQGATSSRWIAFIKHRGQQFRSSPFATEEEAAAAYDEMARDIYGEFARRNFPEVAAS